MGVKPDHVNVRGPCQARERIVSFAGRETEPAVLAIHLDGSETMSAALNRHCEFNSETAGLIGRDALAEMKRDAILINTARGGLIDERALLDALDAGMLHAAAPDVFAVEPPRHPDRLLSHPRVLATPHVAAFTHESIYRESAWALEDAGRVLAGLTPIHS